MKKHNQKINVVEVVVQQYSIVKKLVVGKQLFLYLSVWDFRLQYLLPNGSSDKRVQVKLWQSMMIYPPTSSYPLIPLCFPDSKGHGSRFSGTPHHIPPDPRHEEEPFPSPYLRSILFDLEFSSYSTATLFCSIQQYNMQHLVFLTCSNKNKLGVIKKAIIFENPAKKILLL